MWLPPTIDYFLFGLISSRLQDVQYYHSLFRVNEYIQAIWGCFSEVCNGSAGIKSVGVFVFF
jgi:hypothetical protein